MLEEKDFKKIGELLDAKLDEMAVTVNKGFTGMQKEINGVKEEIKLRPTMDQIMNWGDKKIVSLELDMDKVKYFHQNEFSKLPPQSEISRALAEKGLKKPA
jgi:hypothetical protein